MKSDKRMPFQTVIGLVLLMSLGVFLAANAAQAATDPAMIAFVDREVTTSTGTYQFQVFVPPHWDKRQKWPVILFLHGSGERGTDNRAQTANGIRLLIAQKADRFPCVVVCPQCRVGVWWNDSAMEEMTLKALDQSILEFHGDPNRLYLTGLSMGGYGTWSLAAQYPEKWAAIAPCCGGIIPPQEDAAEANITSAKDADPYYTAAQKIQHIPVWVFHGQADPVVPVSEERQMVAILYAMALISGRTRNGKPDVHYSEYPGVGHDSWNYAYKEPGLLPWLLSHKLNL